MTRVEIVLMAGGILAFTVAALGTLAATSACNTGTGDCPEKAMVVAGAACSDNHLQCAYDLSTPASACDGTTTVIETSCMCTDGTWSCPSPFECDSGTAPATDDAGGDDAGGGDDGGATPEAG